MSIFDELHASLVPGKWQSSKESRDEYDDADWLALIDDTGSAQTKDIICSMVDRLKARDRDVVELSRLISVHHDFVDDGHDYTGSCRLCMASETRQSTK